MTASFFIIKMASAEKIRDFPNAESENPFGGEFFRNKILLCRFAPTKSSSRSDKE